MYSYLSLDQGDSQNSLSPFIQWLDEQVQTKPTLHRSYYRQRINPRISHALSQGTIIGNMYAQSALDFE